MAHSSRLQCNNTCNLINPLDGGWSTSTQWCRDRVMSRVMVSIVAKHVALYVSNGEVTSFYSLRASIAAFPAQRDRLLSGNGPEI